MQTEWVSVRPGLRSEVSSRLCLPFSGGTVGGPEHTGSISSQVPSANSGELPGRKRKAYVVTGSGEVTSLGFPAAEQRGY